MGMEISLGIEMVTYTHCKCLGRKENLDESFAKSHLHEFFHDGEKTRMMYTNATAKHLTHSNNL